jgi:hypothetical protein
MIAVISFICRPSQVVAIGRTKPGALRNYQEACRALEKGQAIVFLPKFLIRIATALNVVCLKNSQKS